MVAAAAAASVAAVVTAAAVAGAVGAAGACARVGVDGVDVVDADTVDAVDAVCAAVIAARFALALPGEICREIADKFGTTDAFELAPDVVTVAARVCRTPIAPKASMSATALGLI